MCLLMVSLEIENQLTPWCLYPFPPKLILVKTGAVTLKYTERADECSRFWSGSIRQMLWKKVHYTPDMQGR